MRNLKILSKYNFLIIYHFLEDNLIKCFVRREWFEKFDGETADIPVDSETFVTGPESSAVGTLSVDTLDESVMEALPVEDSTILVETLNSPGEEEGEEVLQEKYQGLSEQPPIEEDDYIGE